MLDRRNILDQFHGLDDAMIKNAQENRTSPMVCIALNLTHDFNKGSILRAFSANAGDRFIFLNKVNDQDPESETGVKKWDRRGAVGTQNYNSIEYYRFDYWKKIFQNLRNQGYTIFAVDKYRGVHSESDV